MSALEIGLIGLLALWALASVLFLFRIPGVHPWLARWNQGKQLVHWSLFSPGDWTSRPGTFELRYRDRSEGGTFSAWVTGATGHCWGWRAAFWLPERLLATAVQNHGREILSLLRRETPLPAAARARAQILAGYLQRRRPLAASGVREYLLVRRFASDDTEERVLEFRTPDDGLRS